MLYGILRPLLHFRYLFSLSEYIYYNIWILKCQTRILEEKSSPFNALKRPEWLTRQQNRLFFSPPDTLLNAQRELRFLKGNILFTNKCCCCVIQSSVCCEWSWIFPFHSTAAVTSDANKPPQLANQISTCKLHPSSLLLLFLPVNGFRHVTARLTLFF